MPTRRAVTGRSREPRARFAEELRLLRTAHGHSLRQLGDRLGWDWSLFGKMEKGETVGGPEVVQALDVHYGTPGLLLALWELAVSDKTQFKERYRRYMALEADAVSLWHFAVSVLPGLLQTPAYARELLAAGGLEGEVLDQQVEARMGRRSLLTGRGLRRSGRSCRRRPCGRLCGTRGVAQAAGAPGGDVRAAEPDASSPAAASRVARPVEHRRLVPSVAGCSYGGLHGKRIRRRPHRGERRS